MGEGSSETAVDVRDDAVLEGMLTTEVVPCSSLCTESHWTGTLDGTSRFTLLSLEDAQIPDAKISRFHGALIFQLLMARPDEPCVTAQDDPIVRAKTNLLWSRYPPCFPTK